MNSLAAKRFSKISNHPFPPLPRSAAFWCHVRPYQRTRIYIDKRDFCKQNFSSDPVFAVRRPDFSIIFFFFFPTFCFSLSLGVVSSGSSAIDNGGWPKFKTTAARESGETVGSRQGSATSAISRRCVVVGRRFPDLP